MILKRINEIDPSTKPMKQTTQAKREKSNNSNSEWRLMNWQGGELNTESDRRSSSRKESMKQTRAQSQ